MHNSLYRIKESPDLFVDACIRNESGQIMLLSVYGRDTATTGLLGRMQIGGREGGLEEVSLVKEAENLYHPTTGERVGQQIYERHSAYVGDPRRLQKFTGRLPQGIYHNLAHMWIYDPALREPNKAALLGWVIDKQDVPTAPADSVLDDPDAERLVREENKERIRARIWQTVTQLASVPLLPHWREPVLEAIWSEMVVDMSASSFCKPLGGMVAIQVRLTDNFADTISVMVKEGKLTLEPTAKPTPPRGFVTRHRLIPHEHGVDAVLVSREALR
ncbi:MAG: hypothetical protein QM533_05085 [Cytophagales bacterium]|nr:hypothetical protein [Cytophagales bacterium]